MDCIRFSPGESICRGYGRGEYPARIARPNRWINRERDPCAADSDRESPPDSFRLREMASVPDSASVPSAERDRGIQKTDELRRLKNAIAVGTPITGRPPHRTVRAAFLHTARSEEHTSELQSRR